MNKGFKILIDRKNQLLKIVHRDNKEAYILDNIIYNSKGEKVSDIGYWDTDLTYIGISNGDIMKIMDCTGKVLWERPRELPKLTPSERAILDYISMEWKYIARDENGNLWLYKVKPFKAGISWCTGNCENNNVFNLFNQIFEFIKWEDEEPYCIQELLED